MISRVSAAIAALLLGSALCAGEAAAQYYPAPSPQYLPPPPPPGYRGGPPVYDDDMDDAPAYPPGSRAGRPQQIDPRYNARQPDVADSAPYGAPPPDPYGLPPRYATPGPYQPAPPFAPPVYVAPPGVVVAPDSQGPGTLRPPGAVGSSPPASVAALPPDYQPEEGEPKQLPPQFRRQLVDFRTTEPAGTIVIDTPNTYLFLVLGNGKALRYGIGVGREGFTWAGTERVSKMQEWPDWHPPAEMIQRQPYLPRFMAGGEGNPLGARALYLGNTLYRIHGTNQPSTIGSFVSSGCIRLVNEDVEDLYSRVQVGTRVVVLPKASASASGDVVR